MVAFPKYENYKHSGVELLGEIPSHWDVFKLKHIAKVRLSNVDKHSKPNETPVKLCNYTDVYYQSFITEGLTFMEATATEKQISDFELKKGDVLITKDSESPNDIAVPAYVPQSLNGVICGYHLAHITPFKINGSYLFRSFQAENIASQFRITANGITRYGIGKSAINDAFFILPPIEEQDKIVEFLDQKTAEIDQAIEQKQRLIKLLKEQKAILIDRAVTRGLNPNVPMRDSNIDWIGEIPEHWEVKRLKHISPKQSVGLVINPSTYVIDEGIPFLFGGNVLEGKISLENVRHISIKSNQYLAASRLNAGDLVTVRVGYPGITSVIPLELDGCNCASMMIVRSSPKFISQWLCYCMNSRLVRSQVEIVQYGAAQKQFNISHAVNFLLPFPPVDEQNKIAKFLNNMEIDFQEEFVKLGHEIIVLNELKGIFISELVTGKVRV